MTQLDINYILVQNRIQIVKQLSICFYTYSNQHQIESGDFFHQVGTVISSVQAKPDTKKFGWADQN